MKHAIDRLRTVRSRVLCEGWFSGLATHAGRISVLVNGKSFPATITPVVRPDLPPLFGAGSENWGFRLSSDVDATNDDWYGSVKLMLHDGESTLIVDDPARIAREAHAQRAGEAELDFFRRMHETPSPAVLEIGSRERSGNSKNSRLPADVRYTGLDIAPGPNVDVVGDAHFMSRVLPHNHFDFVYSISTFEHLLMPWKAAVELNAVMKTGGLAFIHSHQAWPVHDAPWDFYRFSKYGWNGIFNAYSGFEVIASEHADPATIIPECQINNPATYLENEVGYLMSICVVRKIGDTTLRWDADPVSIMKTAYPA